MSTYSNWREDLIEVIDTPTTEAKASKKVKETKVKNKVVINPKLDEAVKELGGELLEVTEVDDKKDKAGTGEDPQIKSKEKRQAMIKRQVLLKKLQAVRAGGGADITAGYEPEGEMVEGKGYQPEIEVIKSKDLKKKERESKLPPHLQGDAIGKMKKAFASTKKESYEINPSAHKAAQKKTKMRNLAIGNENPNEKAAAEKKAGGPKLVGEGVMKMIKTIGRKKKAERKPQKATDAGAVARRKLQQKDHETVNFLPMNESDKPEKDINKINEKKRKNALQIQKVIGEDKGFDYVLAKLKAKHGDGVLTKGDKIKSPSAAQKKKNAEIMAKRAKQDGRDATEKASDGRYNDRSRSD